MLINERRLCFTFRLDSSFLLFRCVYVFSCYVNSKEKLVNCYSFLFALVLVFYKFMWQFKVSVDLRNSTVFEVLFEKLSSNLYIVYVIFKQYDAEFCILQVKQDGFFPADVLFLASTNPDGVCYIEVFQLFSTNI
jgi:hypothetical protein